MRLFINPEGYVDFEAPLYVEEEYQKKIIDFFKEMFPGKVEVEHVEEPERVYTTRAESTNHHWVPEDYSLLLGGLDNEEIAKKLKLSSMAIIMKRGQFVPDFLSWMKKNGHKKRTIELIEKYFEEMGDSK
ncbi:MAG: hypothetical protein ABIA56_05195 [Actinomycetota bacterium]